ncbi:putative gamma-glutamylcyclotransferase CG2811 [Neocloeon triangulifer]|uniref:putative gamma-glutamylcyclotransferase CG2811 n=1 Tax=Neocloeon triangulifer TaxID=2078957 RepID=UPI00286EDEC6|nr:putative gamma-glutamylcyclotransferase CG2811 [Neocloeon triangulifer]
MSDTQLVFVYGTLKKGEPNHEWMSEWEAGSFSFVGCGKTALKFPLVIASRYNIPFVLDRPGLGHNVAGEIYKIDSAMMNRLDELEDYPIFYNRKQTLIHLNDGTEQMCWMYIIEKFRDDLLQLPFLEDYSAQGTHGLVYCERLMRDNPQEYSVINDIQGN